MKQTKITFISLLTIVIVLVSIICACYLPSDEESIGYGNIIGVWKQQEDTLSEGIAYSYFVINSNDTAEIWTNRGLSELFTIKYGGIGRMYWTHSQTPRDPSWDGDEVIVEYSLKEDILSGTVYPEDNSWLWEPKFDKVDALPVFTYSNDFEVNIGEYIQRSQPELLEDEWQIIEEPGNPLNKILAPEFADGNSDAEIFIHPGKNFSIEFDIKSPMVPGDRWMALDFNVYTSIGGTWNPFWLNSTSPGLFSFNDRNNLYPELSYSPTMDWDIWYTLKVTVREGILT